MNSSMLNFLKKNKLVMLLIHSTKQYRIIILTIVSGLIVLDASILPTASDLKFFGISILYILFSFFYKLKSTFTFTLCLFVLLIMFIGFVSTGSIFATEKAAVWVVLLMIIGIIQQWRE